MLKTSRKSPAGSHGPSNSVDTLIGVNTELLGDIQFSGGLHIDGTVKGKVSALDSDDAMLSISETGSIEGDVHVANVVLNGSIHGDVHARGKITLNSRARVNGNVHYQIVEMASGATVNGQMVHEVEQRQSARVTSLESHTATPPSEDEAPRTEPGNASLSG